MINNVRVPTLDVTKPIHVYRNLRAKNYSLMQKGLVVGHGNTILLSDCRFVVRQGGYRRFLREGRKNVHAFVVGTLKARNEPFGEETIFVPVRYNPRIGSEFRTGSGQPVSGAERVLPDPVGMLAINPQLQSNQ